MAEYKVADNAMKTVFKDGDSLNETSLQEIRDRLAS